MALSPHRLGVNCLVFIALLQLVLCDHYAILGVDKTASIQQIKKAYKNLAKKHHPDKAKGDKVAAEQRFAKIAEAYETLSDPKKREAYDAPKDQGFQFPRSGEDQGFPFPRSGGSGGGSGSAGSSFFFRSGSDAFFGRGGGQPNMGQPPDMDFGNEDMSRMFGAGMFGFGPKSARAHRSFSGQRDELDSGDVRLFTTASGNFHEVTRANRGEDVWLIHFFSRSSHGCRELSSRLKGIAGSLKGLLKVGAVDCDQEAKLCEKQEITKTPTVKLLGSSVKTLTTGVELSDTALRAKALAQLPSHVISLRRENHVNQFFELCKSQTSRGCILLFTDKYETGPLYKRLSSVFKNQLSLGEVLAANKELARIFKIQSYPTLMFYLSENSAPEEFKGKTTYAELHKFLRSKVQRQAQNSKSNSWFRL